MAQNKFAVGDILCDNLLGGPSWNRTDTVARTELGSLEQETGRVAIVGKRAHLMVSLIAPKSGEAVSKRVKIHFCPFCGKKL